jgi:uncharacterized protein involved in cysteine biosynthesis
MLDALGKVLSQMLSPSFRAVLLKSIGLAALLLLVLVVVLHRLLVLLADFAESWMEGALPAAQWPIAVLAWVFSIVAALGLITGAVFLMPAVTAVVAGLFGDEIADEVERTHYPEEPAGTALPVTRAILEGGKIALLSVAVYLCAAPFLLVSGLGFVMFFLATAYLQGRQYFEMAAMRFRPPGEAKALRRAHRGTVFTAGLVVAAFVLIPIVNLATPLFATALMVHLHKRLASEGGFPASRPPR